jgi:hypothetical protein
MIVAEAYRNNFLGSWGKLASIQKPIIGAVAGFAVCPLHRSITDGSSVEDVN